ncbi:elongator complex protein 3 [Salidesulfovibrio onnuriiensis]|uniref:elongator complex protein 3 n=1 Tax=Salidesulfovibrio onnuriiensis TaxID=2583823 RepID=UPI0011C99EE2|nr:radical SAM protein [Salidesulfovibrio onnuriiensis]
MLLTFSHPEPLCPATRVWPVFIPFAGCPGRCVFCAQDKQTGRDGVLLDAVLEELVRELAAAQTAGRGPYELAFFGGTFTALPHEYPERFLSAVDKFRKLGLIIKTRCSTRPDRVTIEQLGHLGSLGLDMVELGVQSFDDPALQASGRGYSGDAVRQACATVRAAGLELGIQLMPGLPGDRPGVFRSDVEEAIRQKPDNVRLYPCLVIRGAELENVWRDGGYAPWSLDRTLEELAWAVEEFWRASIPVIRMGVAAEEALEGNILAGPWHAALGQRVRARVLLAHIQKKAAELGLAPRELLVPRKYSGELFGHARELAPVYAAMGLSSGKIRFHDADRFLLS